MSFMILFIEIVIMFLKISEVLLNGNQKKYSFFRIRAKKLKDPFSI